MRILGIDPGSKCGWALRMFLTKRPERMRRFWEGYGPVPRNFMLGTSITANTARLRDLVKIDARLFVSAEPLRKGVDISPFLPSLSLVIIGGESGPGAGITSLEAIGSLVWQSKIANVPAFVKQLGSQPVQNGRPYQVRDRKGGNPEEWPPELRDCREFPGEESAHG